MITSSETEKTYGVRVPYHLVEDVRRYLIKYNILRRDLKIKKNTKYVYLPVKKIEKNLPIKGIQHITKNFEKHQKTPPSYKELLITVPNHLRQILPTSYDIIGDIILIKLPVKLTKYARDIGEVLLKTHKHVNVVCSIDPVAGELRIRNLKIIAGERRTTTTHTEYGCRFSLDIQKTYFSPRLATERKRITTLVQSGETIVDLFAGVAPFSIMIARYAQPKIIYAVDKNKDAITYAQQNITQNRVLEKIEPLCADAKQIPKILKQKNIQADRIIMNLPFSAHTFFPQALQIAANTCTIHYYDILKEENIPERIQTLQQYAKKHNTIFKNVNVRTIKTYAPREFYIGIDITARTQTPM